MLEKDSNFQIQQSFKGQLIIPTSIFSPVGPKLIDSQSGGDGIF